MSEETCLANAEIVLPDRVMRGAVHVAGGRIAAITEGDAVPSGAVDCAGDVVIPGLVELHTDNLERHIEPRPKVELPHAGAILAHDRELASCGITTVFDALRVGSILKPVSAGGYRKYAREVASEIMALRAAGVLKISHFIHLRAEVCSETLVEEFDEFTPEDRIGLVSLMDHTPGQRQFRDISKLFTYLSTKRAMSQADFEVHVAQLKALRARNGTDHEAATVAAAQRLGAALASHDDTTHDQVRVSAGYGITLAEFPTTIEAAEACAAHGLAVIMGAPNLIRGGSHSGNVSAVDLAERGLLDIVSSDYVPSLLLASAWQLAALWGDLPRAVATVTSRPASAAGLTDRGRLAPGAQADLVRVHVHDGMPVVRSVWRQGAVIG